MILITLLSTSELILVFMMTRTKNVKVVDIRVEQLFLYQTLKMTIHKSVEGVHTGTMWSSLP